MIVQRLAGHRWFALGALAVPVVGVLLVVLGGVPAPLLAGLTAGLALLALAVARPLAGLAYAAVVFAAPLGLWLLGIQHLAGRAFGGREYVLSLSSSVVVFALLAATVVRHRAVVRRWWLPAVAGCVAVVLWAAVGLAHHSVGQTLVGLRITVMPLALVAVTAALRQRERTTLIDVMSWLLVANGIAAVVELIIGPDRLVAWGFEDGRAVRYIDGVFRVPGLTEFNAELGMLAGAYLLGYCALWLTPGARPRRPSWHVAAATAALCLALSTSRSGALLVVGGVLGAVLLNRYPGRLRRRLSMLLAAGLAVGVAAGFAVLGATGASSLLQRLDRWAELLHDVPLLGSGVGGAGAATYSRVADGQPVFVDNYFVSVALQFGPLAAIALVAWLGYALLRLARRSAAEPVVVPGIAVLVGLACSSLMIEAWEYAAAMLCLIVFAIGGWRPQPAGSPRQPAAPVPAPRSRRPALPFQRSRARLDEPVG